MKKVSVAVITYNHERYIRQAIESILLQDYTDYEIIVADDCSTDRTVEVIQDTIKDFTVDITFLPRETNMGSSKNFKRLIESCKGKYVALLDGDDFWIDPQKLTRQVNFLEQNPEYASTFTRARIFSHGQTRIKDYYPKLLNEREDYNVEDVINDLLMPTSSVVYRNQYFGSLPSWFENYIVLDKPLHILNLAHGKLKFFPQVTSVYRIHENGIWSLAREKKQVYFLRERLELLDLLNVETNRKFEKEIMKSKIRFETRLLIALLKNNQMDNLFEIDRQQKVLNFLADKEIYIFGVGEAGENATILLKKLSLKFNGYFDNDPKKHHSKLNGKHINHPGVIKKFNNKDLFIIIGSMYDDEISLQLIEDYSLKKYCNFVHYLDLLNLIELMKAN